MADEEQPRLVPGAVAGADPRAPERVVAPMVAVPATGGWGRVTEAAAAVPPPVPSGAAGREPARPGRRFGLWWLAGTVVLAFAWLILLGSVDLICVYSAADDCDPPDDGSVDLAMVAGFLGIAVLAAAFVTALVVTISGRGRRWLLRLLWLSLPLALASAGGAIWAFATS